jgi:hypothetical protein
MKSLLLCAALAPLLLTLTQNGCKSNKAEATAEGTPSSASVTAPAASSAPSPAPPAGGLVSPVAIPGATVATLPNMSIPQRFSSELAGRPPGVKPSIEDVYAGLEKAGITVVDRRQHLASPFGARYCLGARAVGAADKPMLQMSVCEFVSPEAAKIGRDYSADAMKLPMRTVYVNKQTTLTLREEKQDPEIDALVEKAAAAYAKL